MEVLQEYNLKWFIAEESCTIMPMLCLGTHVFNMREPVMMSQKMAFATRRFESAKQEPAFTK